MTMNRREFLAAAGAGITLTALPLGFASAAAAQNGPRSLVCIFLEGGADSANMYVPLNNAVAGRTYGDYTAARGDFALARSNITPVGNGDFGMNDMLPGITALANAGRAAVIRNVGPLERPTTRADYLAELSLPQTLFAHDAQQRLWQTGRSSLAYSQGWGGAISAAVNAGAEVAPSFSINGSNVWSTSQTAPYTRLSATVPVRPLRGFETRGVTEVLQFALDAAANSPSELERTLSESLGHVIVTTRELQAATADTPENDVGITGVGGLRLGEQLEQVARLILNRDALNMPRQLFFVRMSGWDTHGDQDTRFPVLLNELDRSITAFQGALDGMGVSDSVVTFTASDFGRTLTSNGDGTDHGWGGHAFVFGDAVTSGHFGVMPDFSLTDNADDTGDRNGNFGGRWIPTTSVTQYGATFARWMGLSENQIDVAFPELINFATRDLGFLGAAAPPGAGPGTVANAGDVNCDGAVNRTDARAVLEYLVGMRTDGGACPAPQSMATLDVSASDMDGDGRTTLLDVVRILRNPAVRSSD